MTEKYLLICYYVHSYFETVRSELVVTPQTTVTNFRENHVNDEHCRKIHHHVLTSFEYDLSNNQLCNGIDLFLKSWHKNQIKS